MHHNRLVVSPPHRITIYTTLFRYKNSPCAGCAAVQILLATSAIGLPASRPKLKQALSTPEIMATVIPSANLYSATPDEAPCADTTGASGKNDSSKVV